MIYFIVILVIIALYFYGTRNYKYWELKGIKHDKPLPFVGNNARNYLMQKSATELAAEAYWKYPSERVVGFYRATRPELVIRDPQLFKKILTTDFFYFYPRGLNTHKIIIEPMLRNLFFADGDLWRLLRQRLTPAFTSGKLRAMFPLIVERAELLQNRILQASEQSPVIDARDLMARYTIDFIGACGFGLNADSLKEDDSEFRKLGTQIFQINAVNVAKNFLKELFPGTFKHLKFLDSVEKTIVKLLKEVLRQRNYEPSNRNDFVDLLIECKKKGTIIGESIEKVNEDGKGETAELHIDDELLAAQMFVFFAAGFETSSSATSTALNELAHNPRVQLKVQGEIDKVLAKYNNKLTYEAVKEMTYLEWTFKEAMRVFPSLGFLIRESARKYTFEDLNLTIDEGVTIMIPLQALHNDPQYFEDPQQFRPERFDPSNPDLHLFKDVYLPFGEGPRACIGLRLGLMQSLAGLAAVLARYTVSPAPGAPRRPPVSPASDIVQSVVGGVPLIFEPRTLNN
ncbi:unnamed protein product [Leptosia nina]|uniref:unspecific monooxygenase n=1 Tax=Leptosia nina TaxID=320188 RepID=A0AAV1J762_9NEOP